MSENTKFLFNFATKSLYKSRRKYQYVAQVRMSFYSVLTIKILLLR